MDNAASATVADIVVVEDSPTQAERLRYLLEKQGHTVRVAGNGRLGLEAIRARPPQLVLTDVMMPEMDGYALCQAIRADAALRHLPVVLVTTLTDPTDVLHGLDAGADNLIRKPYDDTYLLSAVQKVLKNRATRTQLAPNEVGIYFAGRQHVVQAGRQQMLDLLISTYDQAVQVNRELQERERQVNELNGRLGQHAAQLEQMNRELGQKNIELELANRAKSLFLANMAHELRTPLNAVIGFSEALIDGLVGALSDEQRDLMSDILQSGEYLLSLINDILDLSKVEAGKMELSLEQVELAQVLRNGLVVVKDRAAVHRIELELDLDARLQTAVLDARKFKQIVFNLLSNAVKFTPDGGKVVLSAQLDSHALPRPMLRVAVRDNGIGISQEDLARLFQPFEQLESAAGRHYEGTGLGLALVKRMAELHGGSVTVDSEPGKGSTFTVNLPYLTQGPEQSSAI